MAKVKGELEDLALKAMDPEAYDGLQRRVAKRRLEREAEINQVITILSAKLAEVGMSGQITGRPKHFYSIYKKMQAGREFDEIYDLTAVRILTPTVRECYGILGLVHSLWKPVPGRFKDFIAIPKSNMYQSSTPRSSARRAIPWRSRSARPRCTGSPRRESPPTGSTRRRRTARASIRRSCGCGSCSSGRRR
jgi:hypothetical protein